MHLLTNGEILEFDAQVPARRSKHKLTANDIIIDGRGAIGDGERILDDRRMMTNAGVFVATIKVYAESMRLVSDPLILSRGFVYGSEQADINKQNHTNHPARPTKMLSPVARSRSET